MKTSGRLKRPASYGMMLTRKGTIEAGADRWICLFKLSDSKTSKPLFRVPKLSA
jgi:hypothetical protein